MELYLFINIRGSVMNFKELNEILKNEADVKESKIKNTTINVNGLKFLKLRDIIIGIGKIYFEDLEKQVYVANIGGGISNKNPVLMALCLEKEQLQISMYAREGLINQHTCEGVINELKELLQKYIK